MWPLIQVKLPFADTDMVPLSLMRQMQELYYYYKPKVDGLFGTQDISKDSRLESFTT
jgi:hypothetical protein